MIQCHVKGCGWRNQYGRCDAHGVTVIDTAGVCLTQKPKENEE